MRRLLVSGAVLAASISASLASPDQRPEPNAFLNRQAHTTAQLVAQVKSDPEVAARFMRHFNMDRGQLISYLAGLRLVKLSESGYYKVYNVHPDGVIRARMFHLKKGTLMWEDFDGTLALKKGCGNPLGTGPRITAENSTKKVVENALVAKDVVVEVSAAPEPLVLMPAAEVLEPAFTVPSEEAPIIEAMPNVAPPTQVIGGGSNGIGWLLGPIIGTLFGGSSNSPPIPEPATILALGVPVVVTLLAKRRK